jgi:uncharacterized protein (DUF4415 family)
MTVTRRRTGPPGRDRKRKRTRVAKTSDRSPAEPPEAATAKRRPGRPPHGTVKLTIRMDPEMIERFRATGPGWQARMNNVLVAAALDLEEHSEDDRERARTPVRA